MEPVQYKVTRLLHKTARNFPFTIVLTCAVCHIQQIIIMQSQSVNWFNLSTSYPDLKMDLPFKLNEGTLSEN